MTATIPRNPRNGNPMRPFVVRNEAHTQQPSRLPTASIIAGALSISVFWLIELSFALGMRQVSEGPSQVAAPQCRDFEVFAAQYNRA